MRLVSFTPPDGRAIHVGALSHDGARVIDLSAVGVEDMFDAVARVPLLRRVAGHLLHAPGALAFPLASVRLLAPLPAARTAIGVARVPAVGRSHATRSGRRLALADDPRDGLQPRYADPAPLHGPGDVIIEPARHGGYAGGVAAVIGTVAHGVAEEDAERYIAGYCVLGAWLAAGGEEPHDEPATALGPWLATPDELGDRRTDGMGYELGLSVAIGGREISRGSWRGLVGGLGRLIARASVSYALQPGDVLGVLADPAEGWSGTPGAVGGIVVEVERLGALRLRVSAPGSTHPAANGD